MYFSSTILLCIVCVFNFLLVIYWLSAKNRNKKLPQNKLLDSFCIYPICFYYNVQRLLHIVKNISLSSLYTDLMYLHLEVHRGIWWKMYCSNNIDGCNSGCFTVEGHKVFYGFIRKSSFFY